MTKTVSENVFPIYVSRCTLGFAIASALGAPIVGFLAIFFRWYSMFYLAGIVLISMGTLCFLFLLHFEKKGDVRYHQYDTKNSLLSDVKNLMQHGFAKFMAISILDGTVRTAVLFWIPTYLRQYVGFGEEQSLATYTIITLCISTASYISNLGVYELIMKRNLNATLLLMFSISTCSFLLMFLCKNPTLNVIFLILAMMADYGASNMLWSVYCPSLRDTGMVSSAIGFLDFLSYSAAAVANLLFANAVESIGWGALVLVWASLMGTGVLISLPYKRIAKAKNVF
jgi:predicted MFS family arabinose efflux permease